VERTFGTLMRCLASLARHAPPRSSPISPLPDAATPAGFRAEAGTAPGLGPGNPAAPTLP